jgi:hypothetical protein
MRRVQLFIVILLGALAPIASFAAPSQITFQRKMTGRIAKATASKV